MGLASLTSRLRRRRIRRRPTSKWTKFYVKPPNTQVNDVEVTHNASPLRTKEFIPGMIDAGDAGFEMNFIPGSPSDVALRTLQQAGIRVSTQMIFPNLVTWTFEGVIKGYEVNAATEEKMTATV